MAYNAYIVKLKELRPHNNADRLQVATVFGNDVVVGLNMQKDDLVLYFPTDGKLSYEFAKENNLLREKDSDGNNTGGYMDAEKRNITTIKLRGERSDGLILSIDSLSKFTNISKLKEGDTIDTINGKLICEKYIPRGRNSNPNPSQKKNQKKQPQESFPFFEQHIDTAQLAYNTHNFKVGDLVYITLKLHGTSQRTAFTIKKTTPNLLRRLLRLKSKKVWEHISGTRRVTLNNFNGGFYGSNEFRKKWHDFFVGKLHKGEEVFYEVVSYMDKDKLIMPECDNGRLKDKEFIKKYGEKTRFTYGCENGESDIYVYRMTITNEDGYLTEYPTELVKIRCEQMGVKYVPILDKFMFTTKEDLMNKIKEHESGIDPIGKTHIREGIIARIEGREKFTALKQKSFEFKVLEGLIKSDGILDIEEEESIKE